MKINSSTLMILRMPNKRIEKWLVKNSKKKIKLSSCVGQETTTPQGDNTKWSAKIYEALSRSHKVVYQDL